MSIYSAHQPRGVEPVIPEFLQTIAEIGIGLAGFSGLVVALRGRSGPLTELQKYRMRLLFMLAFGAMFLALLPAILESFGVPAERIWFDSAATMFVYSTWFLLTWMIPARRYAKTVPEIFNWYAFSIMSAGHTVVVLLQLATMLGIIEARAPGAYAAGLIWYLVHGAQQFMRMLFILPKTEKNE